MTMSTKAEKRKIRKARNKAKFCDGQEFINSTTKSNSQVIKAEYKKSTVHGMGIFASIDIVKGELVCQYEGDVVTKEDVRKMDNNTYLLSFKDLMINGYSTKKSDIGVAQFANDACIVQLDPNKYQCLLRDPGLEHQYKRLVAMLGHADNESFMLKPVDDSEYSDVFNYILDQMLEYDQISLKKQNIIMVKKGNEIWAKALRNIKKGEELFYSYSATYWVEHVFYPKYLSVMGKAKDLYNNVRGCFIMEYPKSKKVKHTDEYEVIYKKYITDKMTSEKDKYIKYKRLFINQLVETRQKEMAQYVANTNNIDPINELMSRLMPDQKNEDVKAYMNELLQKQSELASLTQTNLTTHQQPISQPPQQNLIHQHNKNLQPLRRRIHIEEIDDNNDVDDNVTNDLDADLDTKNSTDITGTCSKNTDSNNPHMNFIPMPAIFDEM